MSLQVRYTIRLGGASVSVRNVWLDSRSRAGQAAGRRPAGAACVAAGAQLTRPAALSGPPRSPAAPTSSADLDEELPGGAVGGGVKGSTGSRSHQGACALVDRVRIEGRERPALDPASTRTLQKGVWGALPHTPFAPGASPGRRRRFLLWLLIGMAAAAGARAAPAWTSGSRGCASVG